MTTYYFLSRLVSPIVKALFHFYRKVTNKPRVRIIVQNEDGQILLLQAWPDTTTWTVPGGGLKPGEQGIAAAVRELREETGIEVLITDVVPCCTLRINGHEELVYKVAVQKVRLPAVPPNRWEVRRLGWFLPDMLPNATLTARRIVHQVVVSH